MFSPSQSRKIGLLWQRAQRKEAEARLAALTLSPVYPWFWVSGS